jgi:hypothetical protein
MCKIHIHIQSSQQYLLEHTVNYPPLTQFQHWLSYRHSLQHTFTSVVFFSVYPWVKQKQSRYRPGVAQMVPRS